MLAGRLTWQAAASVAGALGRRAASSSSVVEASAPAPEAPANDDLAIGSLKMTAED